MSTCSHQVAPLVLRALINHTYSWYGSLVKVRGLGFGSHFLIPPLISVQGRWTVPRRLGPPQVPTCGILRAQYLPKNTCLCICQSRTPACALNTPGSNPQRRGMDADGRILQPPVLPGTVPGGTSYAPQRPLNLRNWISIAYSWTLMIHPYVDFPFFLVPLSLFPPFCSLG